MTENAPRAGRVRRLLGVVRTPGDALLLVRMLAWAAVLPVLKRVLPAGRLVALATPRRRRGALGETYEQKVITLTRWVYRSPVLRDNCLERSLLVHRFLATPVREHRVWFGVRRAGEDFPGHVWVTVDGVPLHETSESLAEFVPVAAFDASGRRVPAGGGAGTAPAGTADGANGAA